MATGSAIEWTEASWNPITGCTKVSTGCKHCYAERMSKRLQAMGSPNYQNGFRLTLHERVLPLPLGWKRPRRIFVNSMSDIFHPDVPDEFIVRMWSIMAQASQHQFQVLTKRPERLASVDRLISWAPNIWMGVSVENCRYLSRADLLRECHAEVKFLSCEPLLGSLVDLDLTGLDWVIAGGESGPGARPMDAKWAKELRDNCAASGVAFFFKQWGGSNKKKTGRSLEGRTWDEFPRANAKERGSLPLIGMEG